MVQATPHRLAIVALLVGLGLTGCGRKGPLELPPGAGPDPVTRVIAPDQRAATVSAPSARPAGAAQAQVGPVVDDPGLIQPPNKSYQVPASAQMNQAASSSAPPPINRPPGPKPGKPFILDPLL